MSCGPTECPPDAPSPETIQTWTLPISELCVGSSLGIIYYNAAQTYVDVCPTGSPTASISVTVQAYSFTSEISQEAADNLAMAAATIDAQHLRELSPCQAAESGSFLLAENGDFLITEDGNFLVI